MGRAPTSAFARGGKGGSGLDRFSRGGGRCLEFLATSPADPAGLSASWSIVDQSLANPGQGAGTPGGAGLRINEFADAADFTKEFVELYYDAGIAPPDTIPMAAITDHVATPESSSSIRLAWTASGDDGATGTAASYDVRMSPLPILTEADFAAATPLAGAPDPHAAGTQEQFTVGSLAADTSYCFALKVSDSALNRSAPSNSDCGTTAPAGGGPLPVSHLVVSRLRVAGSTDDVIELYNPTSGAISLSGHSVQYLAANGNFGFRVNLTGADSVPSHGWYLVAGNGYAGSPTRDDSLGTSNMSASGGHALLVSKTTNVSGCADAQIVDKVGFGAGATCPEGGAGRNTAAPGAGLAVERRPGGTSGNGQDTDVNSDDFLSPAAPTFHNRLSAPATPPTGLGNVGNTLFLRSLPAGTDLDWANAAAATAYRVYRGTAPGFMSG